MAFNPTARAPGKSAMRPKNRVWGFSRNDLNLPLESRRRCPEPRRKSRPTPTFFTPGIPQWPSRDPIGEQGGLNLYGFVRSNAVDKIDNLGLSYTVGYGSTWIDSPQYPADGTPFAVLDGLAASTAQHAGELDQKEWFDKWWPEELEKLFRDMEAVILFGVMQRCRWGTPPYKVDFTIPYTFEQSWMSRNYILGGVTVTYENLSVRWETSTDLQSRKFYWKADMVIIDGLGFNNDENVSKWEREFLYRFFGDNGIGLYPAGSVIRGRWPRSGERECKCKEYLPNLPQKMPLERYRTLWENSPFTTKSSNAQTP